MLTRSSATVALCGVFVACAGSQRPPGRTACYEAAEAPYVEFAKKCKNDGFSDILECPGESAVMAKVQKNQEACE